jgi:hypothetical protein
MLLIYDERYKGAIYSIVNVRRCHVWLKDTCVTFVSLDQHYHHHARDPR